MSLKNLFKCLKLVYGKKPFLIFLVILDILLGIVIATSTIKVVDEIFNYYDNGKTINQTILMIVFYISIILIIKIFNDYYSMYVKLVKRHFEYKMSLIFFMKLDEIDYSDFLTPEFLDRYQRSLSRTVTHIYNCATNFVFVFKFGIRILTCLSIFYFISPLTIIFSLVISFIYFICHFFVAIINDRSETAFMTPDRKLWYLNRTYLLKKSMADFKMSNLNDLLGEFHEETSRDYLKVRDKYALPLVSLNFICLLLFAFLYPMLLAVIVSTSNEGINVLTNGNIAALTTAASLLSSYITNVTSAVGQVQKSLLKVNMSFNLLDMKGKIEGRKDGIKVEEFNNLKIEDVSFKYDETNEFALKNINIEIKKGEKIAIVGANGAGKTTLVKLLLRLYDPTSGLVIYNGKPYNEYDPKSLRYNVGAVFQNCISYATTIAENILMRTLETEDDVKLVNDAIVFSGLDEYVNSLEKGIYTEVTKEFSKDGVQLSGGLIQRLAIARGFCQNFSLFILDEPSSALDPLAEEAIYKNLLSLSENKTLIFISHRLTTTVHADKIYLFDKGEIVEEGTHNELMAKNGLYALMFNSQASKYIGGEDYEQ